MTFTWPLACGDRINSVQHCKYHGCWCPGSLRRQDISTHDIDYVEYVSSCLTWGRVSTTCIMSMWRNNRKCKYMFLFTLKNSACKGLEIGYQNNNPSNGCQSDMPYWLIHLFIYRKDCVGTSAVPSYPGPDGHFPTSPQYPARGGG